jgi:short-subunit dehydrogenase
MLQLDVSSDESVANSVNEILVSAGRIDVLVNNAGLGIFGGAEESSIAQAQQLFDVNFFGTVRMINAVIPHMRKLRSGRILNISSVLGYLPAPFLAFYAASKHAMEGYSHSLDHEVRHLGVRVLLVQPAWTKTSFEQNMLPADLPLTQYDAERKRMLSLVNHTMESKGDHPDVVAHAVLKAIEDSSPKLRYAAGAVSRQLSVLKRFAPTSLMDATLRKQMHLPTGI